MTTFHKALHQAMREQNMASQFAALWRATTAWQHNYKRTAP
jgi:hypothetical protein